MSEMIIGLGMDAIELDRIKNAQEKRETFAERVLTKSELEVFNNYQGHRQMEYLAGRFAAKEAFAKAFGTGIGKEVSFHSIEIVSDAKGKPFIKTSPFKQGKAHLTITHTRTDAYAVVMLED